SNSCRRVCGTNTVYYTVYTSVIKTRQLYYHYTDNCCSKHWTGMCESCLKISSGLQYYAFVSSRQQAKEVVICCVGYAYDGKSCRPECLSKPIGPSHTAVTKTNCDDRVELGDECASECEAVRYGVQYPASYFCSNVEWSTYKIQFQFLTIVSGVLMESACDDCKLTTFKILYKQSISRSWMKLAYHDFHQTERVQYFELNHTLAIKISFQSLTPDPYKIHLELYGCASYKGAYPLGLESGAINDEQIYQDDFDGVTSSYNPQNVRLNSPRQNGWRPWIDSIDNGVEYTFVSFKLDDLVTIDALDIQVGNLDEENNANTFHISFYDYWNENAAKGPLRYTTIPERTSNGQGTPLDITTPAYKKPFETWRYVFPYPIYTKHLYYTVLNHQTPLFHKIEFIGKRGFHAEHSWKMDRNDVFKDMARNHHFYPTPKYRHLAPEGPIQGFAESKLSDNNRDDQPLQSLPFENDDCLVNADYCKHGT
uniref:F5/8 type C domain-containing protein n=1 Tax=Clytia hemisphaerica TaxID=252671 RepID=A0A7M5XAH5_9CNID